MVSQKTIFYRKIAVAIFLLLFILFLTTPQEIFELVFEWGKALWEDVYYNSSAFSFFVSILKVLTRLLITSVFNFGVKYIGYWNQMNINIDILRLATMYLLFTLLIMPTLGLLTIFNIVQMLQDFFENHLVFKEEVQHKWHW